MYCKSWVYCINKLCDRLVFHDMSCLHLSQVTNRWVMSTETVIYRCDDELQELNDDSLHPRAANFEVRVGMNCSNITNLVLQRPQPHVPPHDVRPFLLSDQIRADQSHKLIWKQPLPVKTSLTCLRPDVQLLFLLLFDV